MKRRWFRPTQKPQPTTAAPDGFRWTMCLDCQGTGEALSMFARETGGKLTRCPNCFGEGWYHAPLQSQKRPPLVEPSPAPTTSMPKTKMHQCRPPCRHFPSRLNIDWGQELADVDMSGLEKASPASTLKTPEAQPPVRHTHCLHCRGTGYVDCSWCDGQGRYVYRKRSLFKKALWVTCPNCTQGVVPCGTKYAKRSRRP